MYITLGCSNLMVLYDAFSSSQGIASIVIGFYTEIDANDYRGLHTVWVRGIRGNHGKPSITTKK